MTEEQLRTNVQNAWDSYKVKKDAALRAQAEFGPINVAFINAKNYFLSEIAPYVSPWSPIYQREEAKFDEASKTWNTAMSATREKWEASQLAKADLLKAVQLLDSTPLGET